MKSLFHSDFGRDVVHPVIRFHDIIAALGRLGEGDFVF
jgi:hypothetical protein